MRKLLQLLGFYGDDYDDDSDDYSDEYEEEQPRPSKKKYAKSPRREETRGGRLPPPKLVFFKGVPSEDFKLRLRDVLLDGTMILLDLQGLDADHVEEGRNVINFMGGVAFAHKGVMEKIGPSLFVITPREGMLQWWADKEE